MSEDAVAIRPARPDELEAVAGLRWRAARERQRTPATSQQDFVRRFGAWVRENESSHQCLVLLRGDALIGMAWLAGTRRVPHPGAPERASGDVQSVYVVPEERSAGLGGRLLDEVLALARESGLQRVTVHSSERAVSAYLRAGFAHSAVLLQADGLLDARDRP